MHMTRHQVAPVLLEHSLEQGEQMAPEPTLWSYDYKVKQSFSSYVPALHFLFALQILDCCPGSEICCHILWI